MKGKKFLIVVGFVVLFGLLLSTMSMANPPPPQPPRPSLEILPDDVEGCSPEGYFDIFNTSLDAKDIAEGVVVEILVVKGADYVDHVEYNPIVGTILPGDFARVDFEIVTNDDWDLALIGTEIKIKIVVVNENNWPEHNIGRHQHYTYKQCEQFLEYSIDGTRLDWRGLKYGLYVAKAFALTLFSNGKVDVEIIASNLVNPSGSIETWYAVGDDLGEAESFGWKKSFVISLEAAPLGVTIQFWNKINVITGTSSCDYENSPTITIYKKGK